MCYQKSQDNCCNFAPTAIDRSPTLKYISYILVFGQHLRSQIVSQNNEQNIGPICTVPSLNHKWKRKHVFKLNLTAIESFINIFL